MEKAKGEDGFSTLKAGVYTVELKDASTAPKAAVKDEVEKATVDEGSLVEADKF